jgi:hypothetical protein
MNQTKLTCFSLTCPFACATEAEMEKHEQEHKE